MSVKVKTKLNMGKVLNSKQRNKEMSKDNVFAFSITKDGAKDIESFENKEKLYKIFDELNGVEIFVKLFEKNILKNLNFITANNINLCILKFGNLKYNHILKDILENEPIYFNLSEEKESDSFELFIEVENTNDVLESFYKEIKKGLLH